MRDDMVSNTMVAFLRMLTSCEIQLRADFFAPFIMVWILGFRVLGFEIYHTIITRSPGLSTRCLRRSRPVASTLPGFNQATGVRTSAFFSCLGWFRP